MMRAHAIRHGNRLSWGPRPCRPCGFAPRAFARFAFSWEDITSIAVYRYYFWLSIIIFCNYSVTFYSFCAFARLDSARGGCYHQGMDDKPRLTIKDVASACGVSTATVSYVLNDRAEEHISEQTRKKILHYVNLHGYETSFVARALASGRNHAAGVYAPCAASAPDRARATFSLVAALAGSLETRGLRTVLLTEQCLRQRSRHVDAIVAVDLPRADFYAVGEQNYCPLICVDGCVDDLMLFYQVYDDFSAIASRAREIAGGRKLFFLHDAYANEGIRRRVSDAFEQTCESRDPALALRAREAAGSSAFVAMGRANCAALLALGLEPISVVHEGEDVPQGAERRAIVLPLKKKAETVAALVIDTIARASGPEHDIRVF